MAGERGAQLEEAGARDHAALLQRSAIWPRARALRDRHPHRRASPSPLNGWNSETANQPTRARSAPARRGPSGGRGPRRRVRGGSRARARACAAATPRRSPGAAAAGLPLESRRRATARRRCRGWLVHRRRSGSCSARRRAPARARARARARGSGCGLRLRLGVRRLRAGTGSSAAGGSGARLLQRGVGSARRLAASRARGLPLLGRAAAPHRAAGQGSLGRARSTAGQIALQQVGGGARVGVARSPGALREPRGQALVVKLHRYADSPLEPLGKRPRLTRLVAPRRRSG